jgi:hypothetical protein
MADHDNMLTDAGDASSSSHDRYTTTPEEESPPPPGPPQLLRTTAEMIRDGFMICAGTGVTTDSVVEIRLRSVNRVKIMSTTLSHPRRIDQKFEGPLWDGKETLRFVVMPVSDSLAHTSMELNRLFDSELRKKILKNDMRALHFHVLDFDFTLIQDEVIGRFTAANREHYNSQHVVIWITISPAFARNWTPTKTDEWIEWRNAEDAVGRGVSIQYRVSGSFALDAAELEGIRNFLHYHDPYGDMEGDMGSIMACFKQYFMLEYQRLGL